MTKLEAFKFAARFVVGSGTTTITHSIIRNNVTPSNPLEAVSTVVASVVIGSMAASATRAHTDAQIDSVVKLWNEKSSETPTVTV